jgi:hypothetical protein
VDSAVVIVELGDDTIDAIQTRAGHQTNKKLICHQVIPGVGLIYVLT